jgi:hypothetical protein
MDYLAIKIKKNSFQSPFVKKKTSGKSWQFEVVEPSLYIGSFFGFG